MGSLNSFEWRKINFGMITSMGIRYAKTLTLRGKAFNETRANVRLVQVNHPRSPSLSKLSSQDKERGIQFLESSLKMRDITGYPRLGNPAITPRTLRSFRSLIVPIFAQSVSLSAFYSALRMISRVC
ncbi:hypothetical protein Tco_0685637 [Tanacetum coccineum]